MRGWHKDSYRHYLASKGIRTKYYAAKYKSANKLYFYPSDNDLIKFVDSGIKPAAELNPVDEFERKKIIEELKKKNLKFREGVREFPGDSIPDKIHYIFVSKDESMLDKLEALENKHKKGGYSVEAEDWEGFGKSFGYPEGAIKAGYTNTWISEDVLKELDEKGINKADLNTLEFVPRNMTADEIISEIEKRAEVLNSKKYYYRKVEEDDFNKNLRKNRGYTKIIEINPKKFQELFESDQGEKLVWSPDRFDKLMKIDTVDSYPQVYMGESLSKGFKPRLDVSDGRHRIATAAKKGVDKVQVAVRPEDADRILKRFE